MSAPHDDSQDHSSAPSPAPGDPAATRYGATPPADQAATRYGDAPLQGADPAATRYSDTPADPQATVYPPTPDTAAAPGRLPRRFGGYELLEELGHGGMGVVYKARQFSPERLVALKLIRSGELATEDDVRRFRQEADEAARLDHPNIVPVYEVGEHDGLHFFTMKLVEGGGLDKHLERYLNDPKTTARLVASAARAVHYAHQRQVLHRDLKPGNILLDAACQPHVADFGLAKRMEGDAAMTGSNAIVGTPEYMAPEQASGEKRLTTAVDVYALGGVLYALLTGRPPFQARTPLDVLVKVVSEEPAPPSKVRPGVPQDLATICLKCLARQPARRYGSAEAMAEDLERWLRGEPVWGRPVGRLERALLWCKRSPVAAGLLAAFVAALLIGTGVSTYFAVMSNLNYQDARKREKDANDALGTVKEQKDELGKANAQLEETLARGLLRPIGHDPNKVTDPEVEALWDLAGSNERVQMLFVEMALQRPLTTQQLRNRADMALHSAVGLDSAKRRRVEAALLTRLRDAGADFTTQMDCVYISLDLGDLSPEYAKAAGRQALESMGQTRNTNAMQSPEAAVAALAPRMRPADAADAAQQALEAMGKTSDLNELSTLATAVGALAPRMEHAHASRAAADAVRILMPAGAKVGFSGIALTLSVLVPHLEPKEAEATARKLLFPIARSGLEAQDSVLVARLEPFATDQVQADKDDGVAFSPGVRKETILRGVKDPEGTRDEAAAWVTLWEALARRLDVKATVAVAQQALEAMGKTDGAHPRLAVAVGALAPRMEPAEAVAAARQVLEEMGTTNRPEDLVYLAAAVGALAPRMEPADAVAAARRALEEMGNADNDPDDDYGLRVALAEAMAALSPRMEPADAADAARQAIKVMGKEDNDPNSLGHGYTRRLHLVTVMRALSPRLKPSDASTIAQQVLVMIRTNDHSIARAQLVEAMAVVAARLEPADAAGEWRILEVEANRSGNWGMWADVMAVVAARLEPADAAARWQICEAKDGSNDVLAALAARLEPAEAASAARRGLEEMSKTNNPFVLCRLATTIGALAPRMKPAEAARSTSAAARQAMDAMRKPDNHAALLDLASALAALAPWMEPADAARSTSAVARQAMDAMRKPDYRAELQDLARALAALAPWMEPADAAHCGSAAAGRILNVMQYPDEDPQGDVGFFGPGGFRFKDLGQTLEILVAGPVEQDRRQTAQFVGAVGTASTPQTLLTALAPLTEVSGPRPGHLTEQDLVDILKMPICDKWVRHTIVQQLGRQCGQTFADQWEFIAWAREHRSDLDLTSPPVRPTNP